MYELAIKKDENIMNQILEAAAKNELYQELWNRSLLPFSLLPVSRLPSFPPSFSIRLGLISR